MALQSDVFDRILEMMTRTVTLRLPEEDYRRIKAAAEADNRPISNFLQTAALRFIEHGEFCSPEEMKEIRADRSLMRSLKRGSEDHRRGRYTLVRNRRNA